MCHIEKDVMSKRILLNLAQRVSKWIVNEVADGDPYVCNFVIIMKMCSQIRHAAHGSIVFMFSFSEFKLLYTIKATPKFSQKMCHIEKVSTSKHHEKSFGDAIFAKINSFGVTSMQRTFSFGFPWKAENVRKRQQTSSDIYYSMRIVTEWTSRGIKQMKCDCSLEINFILSFFFEPPKGNYSVVFFNFQFRLGRVARLGCSFTFKHTLINWKPKVCN